MGPSGKMLWLGFGDAAGAACPRVAMARRVERKAVVFMMESSGSW